MNFIIFVSLILAAPSLLAAVEAAEQEQQGVQRRAVSNLGARIRQVATRSAESTVPNSHPSFGLRSSSESSNIKTRSTPSDAQVPNASASTVTPTTTTTAAPTTGLGGSRADNRQQSAPVEVETLSSAPSSWQLMTAVEAPVAALIASGTRPAAQSSDLTSASSEDSSLLAQNDFLRSPGGTKGGSSGGSAFSHLRQQTSKTRQQQQSFFQPQQQGKTSSYQATKTNWYKPPSTTPRPAPIVQQQYEQQSEQYSEQQQVDSAPPGQAEPFAFDFNTQDDSGNGQYRKEESDNNGVVRGSYGFRDASGIYRHVEYVADQNGFRANIKSNEPGVEGGPDSQPASIRLDGGAAPTQSQRFTNSNNNDSGDWAPSSSSSNERGEVAIAPPEFESSHKAERIRAPINLRS